MRKTVFTFALGAMIAPALLAAQDATKAVAGGGEVAPGWQMRIDPRAGGATPPKFVAMGSGWHATTGSRAIFWRPGDVAKGNGCIAAGRLLLDYPDLGLAIPFEQRRCRQVDAW